MTICHISVSSFNILCDSFDRLLIHTSVLICNLMDIFERHMSKSIVKQSHRSGFFFPVFSLFLIHLIHSSLHSQIFVAPSSMKGVRRTCLSVFFSRFLPSWPQIAVIMWRIAVVMANQSLACGENHDKRIKSWGKLRACVCVCVDHPDSRNQRVRPQAGATLFCRPHFGPSLCLYLDLFVSPLSPSQSLFLLRSLGLTLLSLRY